MKQLIALIVLAGMMPVSIAQGEAVEPLGIAMENHAYPYPVAFLPLRIEGQDLRMAYMDVAPADGVPSRGTVLLLHGKNFFGAYWADTIGVLSKAGYRVVAPDQIGFGKSSKPDVHYSFHLLARNTRELLEKLGVKQVAVVGHSMGGMLATRFALMFPEMTTHLILENPIGLEDYRAKAPYVPTEKLYEQQMAATAESIRKYQQAYYVQWKPAYETYVQVQVRWMASGEYPRLARAAALTSQMIYEQPVVHELHLIKVKTLLVIGQEDRTAIGKDRVSPEVAKTMGDYPALGKKTRDTIAGAKLVELEECGHIPHFEKPPAFHEAVVGFLGE